MKRRRRRISSPKPATWARNGTPTPTEKSNNGNRSKDTVVVREPRPRSDWSEKPRRKQGRVETSRIDGTKTAQVRNGAEGIDLAAFPKFALAREDRWDAYMREEGKSCGQGDAFLGDGLPEERKGEDTYNCRGGSEGAHPLCR